MTNPQSPLGESLHAHYERQQEQIAQERTDRPADDREPPKSFHEAAGRMVEAMTNRRDHRTKGTNDE